MGNKGSFEDLVVWQKAHNFVLSVYKVTASFPKEELFGLTSQFRRAAVSIAANIAEGYKKKGVKDKLRFYNTSQGSMEECKYYLILSQDLNYAKTDSLRADIDEIGKMLESYMNAMCKNNDLGNSNS